MNIFRLIADLSHLASILILLLKIHKTKSCAGISFKTQLLYALVFLTRYPDLFWSFVSYYNTIMKIFFIVSSIYIVYLVKFRFKATYDAEKDYLRIEFILLPVIILALCFNYEFEITEILWTFSIYLEAVAVVPQLFMIQRHGEAETITAHYLAALGIYRALYIANWIVRYQTEGFVDYIVWVAGIVQTALYADFLYLYVFKVLRGEKLTVLPQ
eukprot:Lithocolla_globosa_v1_NODE_9067_length_748_cov_132.755043.p1 type:complete len:214 gc:universal NODE_9067_length_748_cov_132.755043:695-54(-)